MAPTKTHHLRLDMGGRFLGDPRAFLLFVPLWWGLSLIGVAEISDSNVFGVTMLANACSFAATVGLLIVFRHTWFRNRVVKSVPTLQVITAGAILGATKSLVTVTLTAWMLSTPDIGELIVWRLPAGAVTGAWILPAAALLLATQDRYQTQREILVAELLRHQFLSEPSKTGLRVEDPTDTRVRAVITEAKTILGEVSIPPEEVAQKLRHLIDTQLRPLSHELWANTSRKFTDFSVSDLLRVLLSQYRYWVWPTTLFVMLTNGPFVISTVGWSEGLGRVAIISTVAFLTLLVLRAGRGITAAQGSFRFLTGALVVTFFNEILAFSLYGPFSSWSPAASGAVNAAIFVVNAVVLGVASVARHDNQDIRNELETLLGESSWRGRIDSEQTRLRHRETAELLHGRVQNRLLSVVLALTSNQDSQHREAVAVELSRIEQTLFGTQAMPLSETADSLEGELATLSKRWAGVVTVSFASEITDALGGFVASMVGKAAEEAISNATRHGLASTVHIHLRQDGPEIVMNVLDDGVGPRNGRPGLGSLYLSQICGENWSLHPGPTGEGSLLSARFTAPARH